MSGVGRQIPLSWTYQLSDIWVWIVGHGILERFQKVLLELEMGQFFLLQEPHGKLPERIQCEETDMRITMTADLVKISVTPRLPVHTESGIPG